MGNCLKKQAADTSDDDDWGFDSGKLIPATRDGENLREYEETTEESMVREKAGISKEVKIKITKKQLEEFLGRVNVQGLSIEQLLSQLISMGYHHELRHRPWKPVLHTIPEDLLSFSLESTISPSSFP